MVLSTHCYRDSLCVSATSMRPVCDLHDCSQIKMPFGNRTPFLIQDMVDWWFGLLSYSCVFTHLSTWKYLGPYAKLHENATFVKKNYKNFLGRGNCPLPRSLLHRGEGYPSPDRTHGHSCHGCPQNHRNAPAEVLFLPRDAMQTLPLPSCGVCLSVCQCVCASRSYILSKRIKISSNFFHRRLAKPF